MYDSDTGPISAVMNYRLVEELLVGKEGNLGLRRIRFGLIRLVLVCLPISIQFHLVFTWLCLAFLISPDITRCWGNRRKLTSY